MDVISRDQLKKLFQDVKYFRIDEQFDHVDFSKIHYYSFFDQTDFVFYTVYNFEEELIGIKWNCSRPASKPLSLGLCDICKKHRERDGIISIYTKTRHIPKHIAYRSRGFQICFDYLKCNEDLKNMERLHFIYSAILNP